MPRASDMLEVQSAISRKCIEILRRAVPENRENAGFPEVFGSELEIAGYKAAAA
jgi:hypothetical protein